MLTQGSNESRADGTADTCICQQCSGVGQTRPYGTLTAQFKCLRGGGISMNPEIQSAFIAADLQRFAVAFWVAIHS